MILDSLIAGRTIRQFITYTLTLPTFYAFFWFSIFGGIGLKMERDAAIAGITCDSILGGKDATESWNGLYRLSCRFVAHLSALLSPFLSSQEQTSVSTVHRRGSSHPESSKCWHPFSFRSTEDRWFDVIQKYEGIGNSVVWQNKTQQFLNTFSAKAETDLFLSTGTFLSIVSVISLVLYFVTSSDSGSLVIDCLSANGHPDPPVIQRIFWALTEGATATGLLVAGGSNSLAALQVRLTTFLFVNLP